MDGLTELARRIDQQGSRGDFAKRARISESYLSNILAGRQPISRVPYETAQRISAEAGIPMEQLGRVSSPGLAQE